jgi:CubicO group peptidase (beta-lactamase class C family)
MVTRPLFRLTSLIAPLALLPALLGCHSQGQAPLSPEALAAVKDHPGASRELLARTVDGLFTASDIGETRALVVMYKGRVVAERYGPGYDQGTPLIGWSMSKTVTGVLVGLLVADGRLRLDESLPVPAWQRPGDPRGEITLRQLLQMRSGLRHVEGGEPARDADTVRMLFTDGRDDMAAYAEAQPLETEPGRNFRYSTATSVILSDIATRALTDSRDPATRRQIMADYLHTRLFEPLGMKSAVAEYDAAGTLEGGSMIHATARDWARFGEFLRLQGSVQGVRVVPSDWVHFMTTPSPRNPAYGAQLWLNRTQDNGKVELFPARGPRSLFAAVGHGGQYVIVSPDQQLTIVRLGKTSDAQRPALVARLADIAVLFGGGKREED